MENKNFNLLTEKLNAFIRKYYINQLIKGSIYATGLLIVAFLSAVFIEYFFYLKSPAKPILFFSFLACGVFILINYIIIPLLKISRLGETIDYYTAAKLIGKHFGEVNDKIVNTLQLQKVAEKNPKEFSLLLASIEQKIEELKPVPFQLAIDFKGNRKYAKYALIPILVLMILSFTMPSFIKDGTKRLVDYNKDYSKPLPFYLNLENSDLKASKNEDFEITVASEGSTIPQKAFIEYDNTRYKMRKTEDGKFAFTFKNIQEGKLFKLISEPFISNVFEIEVLPTPVIKGVEINLEYPEYTNRKSTTISNNGDLIIPEGTVVNWMFSMIDVDSVKIFANDTGTAKRLDEFEFSYSKEFTKSTNYLVTASNNANNKTESVNYCINVINDQYPSIEVQELADSLTLKQFYFNGELNDDYGIRKLNFVVKKNDSLTTTPVQISTGGTQENFYFTWTTEVLNLKAGDEINYYFEVFDNDGVNGSKSTKSKIYSIKVPSKSEIKSTTSEKSEEIKDEIEEAIKEAKDIQAKIDELTKKVLEKKQPGWQEKQQLQQLMEQRESLEEKVKNLMKKNSDKNKLQNEFLKPDPQLLEKQKQLEKLFENIMDEEMKKLLEEMEKLMEKMDKNQFQENLEKFKLSNEDVEKELDRTLELFKQFEFEQDLKQAIEEIEELQKEQEELQEKTDNKEESAEDLKKKQDELNKKAEELSKDLEKLEEKNEELEEKHPFPDQKEDMQEMLDEMEKSSEELDKKNNKKSSESQENAQEKMEQMKQSMSDMMSSMQSEQQSENMEDLRALLENLIELSFDQENLMEQVKTFNRNDPAFVTANQEQKKLKDNAKMIEDSLFALSKRVVQLEAVVNKEINSINDNMEKAIKDLADRNSVKAATRQQFVMTSTNNLALILDEVLQQMQQQMQSMMQGKGECTKPGSGKPSASDLKKKQQGLNQQLKQMMEKMKNGEKPGGEGQGQMPGMSKEIAKMAAEQAAIREALKEIQNQLDGEGNGGSGEGMKKLQELMEQTEEDLVNFQLRQETLQRQEEILTRLLESEKAEREREYDNKRESKEADEISEKLEKIFEEYKKKKEKETELLRTVPPNLNLYYKTKVAEYFNEI